MGLWLLRYKDAIHTLVEMVTAAFAVLGGMWGLYQYFKGTRLRATETLLKVEDEFRVVLPVYVQIEDLPSYERLIKPALNAEAAKTLTDDALVRLIALDRALRFLYFCSVLNESLRADRALGVKGGALQRAYYHYLAFLLPERGAERPDLLAYTNREYPRLTKWVQEHASELRAGRR